MRVMVESIQNFNNERYLLQLEEVTTISKLVFSNKISVNNFFTEKLRFYRSKNLTEQVILLNSKIEIHKKNINS